MRAAKQFLQDQRIIDCLRNNYGIEATVLTLLPLGADINASVYKAQTFLGIAVPPAGAR